MIYSIKYQIGLGPLIILQYELKKMSVKITVFADFLKKNSSASVKRRQKVS